MTDQLALLLVGSTFHRINISEIKALTVIVPPRLEQDRIAEYLDDRVKEIDTLISACRSEQTLLREYRTRLIADVVTGKLDVREAAARLSEEAEGMSETEILEDQEIDDSGQAADSNGGES